MQIVLVMFRSDGQRRSFSIHKDVTVLGRREDCDVRIPLGEISRKHCRIVRDDAENVVRVEDMGSSNGTFVNGQRVQRAVLQAGDTLQVGPVAFVVQLDGMPADQDLVAPGTQQAEPESGPTDEQHTIAAAPAEPAPEEFDPSSILGGPEDSGAPDAIDSAVVDDIAEDLQRADRSN